MAQNPKGKKEKIIKSFLLSLHISPEVSLVLAGPSLPVVPLKPVFLWGEGAGSVSLGISPRRLAHKLCTAEPLSWR